MAVDTEKFIKDAAANGWSRNQVAEALNISWHKLQAILEVMQPLTWGPGHQSVARKQANQQRRGYYPPRLQKAQQAAMAAIRKNHTHMANGVAGTIKELAKIHGLSASTVRRRMSEGCSIEEALSRPPTPHHKRKNGWK